MTAELALDIVFACAAGIAVVLSACLTAVAVKLTWRFLRWS